MVFYEITAKVLNLSELLDEVIEPDRGTHVFAAGFDAPAKKVFEANDHQCCVFLKTIKKRSATAVLGAIAPDYATVEKQLHRFLEYAEIQADDIRMSETTMQELRDMLRVASRGDFIEDDDDYLEAFELDDFLRCAPHYFEYSEKLLKEGGSIKLLEDKARQLACEDQMLPELERIVQGAKRPTILGHPVHYKICSDDNDVTEKMTDLLLTSLLRGGRIHNHRFGILQCDESSHGHKEYLDMAFRYCFGGALAIDMKKVSRGLNESDEASNSADAVISICECIQKYRNNVLAVLCLPRSDTACKTLIQENLGSISLVELEEDMLYGDRAKRFLRTVAKRNGITAPRSLMKQLDDPEKGWLPGDLKALFERWFSNYLREDIYPQYASFTTASQELAQSKPVGSAYTELEAMIGLSSAKEVIQQALDYYKAQKLFRDRGVKLDTPSMHMVFTGNPGTAKTTVARLFARIMKENGVLSQGNLIEVGRGDLVGKYVGWTAQTVKQKFRAAKGSVLFIDEAYSLLDSHENSFGDEAINTIVQEMENCRDNTVVIFAGYPKPMEEFLNRNPGLRSRIAFHVPFEDYSAEELYDIVETMTTAKGLNLSVGVRDKLLPIIRESMRSPDFGNGRYARNLVEKAAMRQASRLVRGDVVNVTDRELRTLLPEDFEKNAEPVKQEPRVIGFSA